MLLGFFRPALALGAAVLSASAMAQTAPTLRDAVQSAWALTPQARAEAQRAAEFDARARAAGSWLAGSPGVGISHRTDRIGSNGGLRESEVELSAPVWWPRVRSATAAQVDAERAAFERQQSLARYKLAAEVRELAAQVAIARIEREVAARKLDDARALADDVTRRVRAGDSARVDQLQAVSNLQHAIVTQTQADAAYLRSLAQWRTLTGLESASSVDEQPATPGESPARAAAEALVRAAEARLRLAQADRADAPEVGIGVTRERPAFGAAFESSLKLSLRVPLGTPARNAPRLAAAQAELQAAQAELDAAERQATGDRAIAEGELEAMRRAEAAAAERARAATQVHALIANAYRLGESDLPTRLRAEAERFEAERAHARAQVETRRAISKLNQTLGVLP